MSVSFDNFFAPLFMMNLIVWCLNNQKVSSCHTYYKISLNKYNYKHSYQLAVLIIARNYWKMHPINDITPLLFVININILYLDDIVSLYN